MNWSDEKLSAFLDAELPATEMEALREALARDAALADRLAALAAADAMVMRAYGRIDDEPLPESVQALLTAADAREERATHSRRHRTRSLTMTWPRAAVAAGIALAVGLGLGLGQDRGRPTPAWTEVAAVLEQQASGQPYSLSGDARIKPRLTYLNQQGDYCRQFVLTRNATSEEAIACRRDGSWEPVLTIHREKGQKAGPYRTASGGSPLDAFVDRTLSEGPLDRAGERNMIERQWQRNDAATGR